MISVTTIKRRISDRYEFDREVAEKLNDGWGIIGGIREHNGDCYATFQRNSDDWRKGKYYKLSDMIKENIDTGFKDGNGNNLKVLDMVILNPNFIFGRKDPIIVGIIVGIPDRFYFYDVSKSDGSDSIMLDHLYPLSEQLAPALNKVSSPNLD